MTHSTPFENKEFAALFSELRRTVASGLARKVIDLAEIKDGDSLLDLGCGPALVSKSIMQHRSLRYALLIDRSMKMTMSAKENLNGLNTNCDVKCLDLEKGDTWFKESAKGPFDHVIAIDLWHLLTHRKKLSRLTYGKLLVEHGNLTLALHKEISIKRMRTWHQVRSEIREQISSKLRETYPRFEFGTRSRGATVHGEEVSTYLSELSAVGFKLTKRSEDSRMADINQMVQHLPESFTVEVKRALPKIPGSLLKTTVDSSVRTVLRAHRGFAQSPIATEVFYVFTRT